MQSDQTQLRVVSEQKRVPIARSLLFTGLRALVLVEVCIVTEQKLKQCTNAVFTRATRQFSYLRLK